MEPEIFLRAPYSPERGCGIGGFKLSQWTSEAKLVAIRIGQVKEPLAPFGIARCRVWSIAGRDHARMEGVDFGMVEDDASPPRPISLRGLCDEIEKARSSLKTCKRGVIATMNDLKSQHAIEGDGARHVVGGERDSADALDHRGTAPFFVSCIGLHDGRTVRREPERASAKATAETPALRFTRTTCLLPYLGTLIPRHRSWGPAPPRVRRSDRNRRSVRGCRGSEHAWQHPAST